ncbi:MAG TPA: transposase [Pyrinomonadaceae bacterium]|jgi:hypothetical protein
MHIDPARLEEVLAGGASIKEVCQELGVSDPTLYQRMKREPELKAAFDRGRKRAKAARAEPELDDTTKDVLEEIRDSPGSTENDLKNVLNISEGALATSLHILTRRKLIEGSSVSGVPRFSPLPTPEPVSATVTRKKGAKKRGANRSAPKARPSRRGREVSAAATQNILSEAPPPAPTAVNGDSTAHAIEAALVELHYVRIWGSPSPKCDEVLGLLAQAQNSFALPS